MLNVQHAVYRRTPRSGCPEGALSASRKNVPLRDNRYASGFTLVEILISVGIIVLLTGLVLAGVLAAKKHATETRIQSDMALIGNALEAYKGDFGQYPVFADAQTDYNAQQGSIQGGGWQWLDNKNYRGAVLLCRALIGPGPSGNNLAAFPGDDGADGPGFRLRRIFSPSGQLSGKVYGPYVDAGKFKIGTSLGANCPVLQDILGNPILYYPATPGNPLTIVGYTDLSNPNSTNVTVRFNGFDNDNFVPAHGGSAPMPPFQTLAAHCGTPNYLLWSAGIDGIFGYDPKGKCDDITLNVDLAK